VTSTATAVSPSRGEVLERLAWRVPLSTRRLFVTMTAALVILLVGSGVVAAWAVSRNASTIDSARSSGLGIARAATQFRSSLASADADAAATLISGGLEEPERRAHYDASLVEASRALTGAALVARGGDADDIGALADGLVVYSGLVETSRANSRQGFPVGSAYLSQARTMAQAELVPRAERLRRTGEQRIARAANSVSGPVVGFAIGFMLFAIVGLAIGSAVAAGRTRRLVHPGLVAAMAALIVMGVIVTSSLLTQRRELLAAATADKGAYLAANDSAFTLSNLRVNEIGAVAARGSGAPLFKQFHVDADSLVQRLSDRGDESDLLTTLRTYVSGVDQVEALDQGGDNRAASTAALTGASGVGYEAARERAASDVAATANRLGERFDAASRSDVQSWLPTGLCLLGAAFAAAAMLARARRYR
jgi:hypothetical protein